MQVASLFEKFDLLHEVTAYLTVPELLQLRGVSTAFRHLLDTDDLWERRFLLDANLLSKAIFFAWIHNLSSALQAGEVLAAKESPAAGQDSDTDAFLKHSWVFVPDPRFDMVKAGSISEVREGMLRRLCTEFRRQCFSVVFTPFYWDSYLNLTEESRIGIADSKSAGLSVKAVEQNFESPGQRTVVDSLSTAVFVRLFQASGDIGTATANSLGFDRIRQILFGRRVSVECLAASRFLNNLHGRHDSTTAKYPPVQGPRYILKHLFRDHSVISTTSPFFNSWKEVYQFFLVPLTEDHPFAQLKKRCAPVIDRLYTTCHTWNSLARFYGSQVPHQLSKAAQRSAAPEDIAAFHLMVSIDGFRTGIHRTLLGYQTAMLVRARVDAEAQDLIICLAWLTGAWGDDLTPFARRLIRRGPIRPGPIFSSDALPPSRAGVPWRLITIVFLPFGFIRLALSQLGPTLLFCTVAFCLTVLARLVLCAKKSRSETGEEWGKLVMQDPRQGFKCIATFVASCFVPVGVANRFVLASPAVPLSKRLLWGIFLSYERWKCNVQRVYVWGKSFLFSQLFLGLVVLSISLGFSISFENCWRKELTLLLTGWQLKSTLNRLSGGTEDEQVSLLRLVLKQYNPTGGQLISGLLPSFPLHALQCQCFDCVADVRGLPVIAHLLRQITDLEVFLVPVIISGEILYTGIAADEMAPSFSSDIVKPVLLCVGSASLALFVSFCLNIIYWSVALTTVKRTSR